MEILKQHDNYVVEKNRDFRSSSTYMESWGYFSDNRTMFIMSMPLARHSGERGAFQPVYHLGRPDRAGVRKHYDVLCHEPHHQTDHETVGPFRSKCQN